VYALKDNIFVSLIIPEHPGNKMGVYIELLIDELVCASEEGVWTYDRCCFLVLKCYKSRTRQHNR
jgi:hypothetical protein